MGVTREQASKGTRIRVDMEATVSENAVKGPNGTTQVRDTRNQNNHFVFLLSDVVTGDKKPGGKIKVKFDGSITGDYEGNELVTTLVTDSDGYVHYLFLLNPTITLADVAEGDIVRAEPAKTAPKRTKGELTVTINSYDDTINSDDVRTAIRELTEDSVKFAVIRNRNDEELGLFDDRTEALDYIDEEDLNPERVRVDETVDPDIADELADLKRLDSDGDNNISGWGYGVTLYRESYVDEDFAKSRYEETNDIRGLDLDAPPFSFIDWDRYADLLKEDAEEIDFDGVTYYAL